MSEMVERVAQAICDDRLSLFEKPLGGHQQGSCQDCDDNREKWRAMARIAIRAMQGDPGHDITAALCKPTEDRRWAVNAWQVMIDAALK